MRTVTHNDVRIVSQAFGSGSDPALILIMGATASMLTWPDDLCEALARRGLFVIRFDHRDTGASTTVSPGAADYSVEDMARDVIAVADAYELDRVHLMGMSLGAYIAQMLALTHPDRIASLTLIAAEPLGWDGDPLPHISDAFMAHFGALATLDWSDAAAVSNFLLEIDRLSAGPAEPFDEAGARDRIAAVLARSDSPASMFNHSTVGTTDDWTGAWRRIEQPVLVIHGEADPVLPLENGKAIADGVERAELLVRSGVGHELPLSQSGRIADRVAAHIGRSGTR